MARSLRFVAVLLMVAAVTVTGCAKKKRITDESAIGDGTGTGAEESLSDRSSLGRYKHGLGPEEDGILKDVHFAYDSYELGASARDVLAANAEWLKENRRARTEIEGHCDERGTVEYNLALGAKRAKAVKDYLVSLGVASERLTTISYGEELPLCRDASEQCYARNRRVHFVPPSE
ncbi:MAG: peptidoglycan-associated lipoprotein [Polyangiaceae bacterium UTPRO1]|jgi:peptidoglycan-associated lipoprotein|nr:peptidoglycan-associated lipoprotein Pal [Myxococcales bacterium]OQY66582.1 MAG: peptidoglycan-associated lipoprotein [Polyangiaceae bacterium UTPRO1]